MEFTYEYYFVPHGKTKNVDEGPSNEIWLDVGNKIEKNIFDHHNSEQGYISTVDVLVHEFELLEETKKSVNFSEPIRFYTHAKPDMDALFACFYVQYYFEHGPEQYLSNLVNGDLGKTIVQYVNDIDSGIKKNAENVTLYGLVCHLDIEEVQNKWGIVNEKELSNKMMDEALSWINKAFELVQQNPKFNLYDWSFPIEDDEIANIIKEKIIGTGKYNYERDKREDRLVIKDIPIWTKTGEVENVKAAIWREVPLSPSTSYIYARKEGAVLTFVPHHEYGNNSARISINPNIKGAVERYSLIEVAEMFEQLEQIYDKKTLIETGSLRRDYSRPRGDNKSKIMHEKPFSVTVDPWYVSNSGDMVDGPGNGGSLIPFDVMVEVLENITRMVKRTFIVDFNLKISNQCVSESVKVEENVNESLLGWARNIKNRLINLENNIYPLIICEVDASLISHNYDILDAYFMSLSDGAYVDADSRTVLRLDYRTHLYVNQANAVVFVATSDITHDLVQMDGLLDWADTNTVESSKLIDVFSKVIYQREKFKDIGRFLGTFKENERKINKQKEELIVLLAKAQADECIDSQVELDVFQFIYQALNVAELRESVKDTMDMVSEFSKERVYANLNFLSLITIPFILFSTLFQIGVVRFSPILDLGEDGMNVPSGIPWMISLIVVIIITVIFFFARKKK